MGGNRIQIPRIALVAGIALIVMIAVILFVVILGGNEEQPQNNEILQNEQVENVIDNTLVEEIATDPLPKVEIDTIATKNSTINGEVPCYYNPVIPKGFKAVGNEQDSTIDVNAKWGVQSSYLFGLVIEDADGNQFVWVPVENMDLFKTTDWQKNEPTETIASMYKEPLDAELQDYNKMKQKVRKYGGFYVGRFETGDEEATVARTGVKNSDKIGIKKNLHAYDYVPFSMTTINKREITGAKELAIKYGKSNTFGTITSSVMYGVQWDAMLRFVVTDLNNVNDSVTWGNYPNTLLDYQDAQGNKYQKAQGEARLLLTGSSEQTKAKNIYDIAGNLYEWTIESAGNNVRVVRGGAYLITIGQLAASRYSYNYTTANNAIGFRISFYVE